MNRGNLIDCPVKGCPGFRTTSGRPNLGKHIALRARVELLDWYMNNQVDDIPHADYMKENFVLQINQGYVLPHQEE